MIVSIPQRIELLASKYGWGTIREVRSVPGGSINDAFALQYDGGQFFVKWNRSAAPGFFSAEADGLRALAPYLRVPEVLYVGDDHLVLEYLPLEPGGNGWARRAGEQLAQMHLDSRSTHFGWIDDNFMGSLPQRNRQTTDGAEFYRHDRWQNLWRQCRSLFPADFIREWDGLVSRFADMLPDEQSVLIHGDLWSGNIGYTSEGPVFFDPAVHWGYREADLAMTRLFGRFPPEFYEGYQSVFPLESGWEQRVPLFQLYPLLVHVCLFGRGYVSSVMDAAHFLMKN